MRSLSLLPLPLALFAAPALAGTESETQATAPATQDAEPADTERHGNEILVVAERIRAAIADWPFVLSDGQHISVTTSIGLMLTIPAQTHDIDALLAAADHALYRSKANGRNRVELANPQ